MSFITQSNETVLTGAKHFQAAEVEVYQVHLILDIGDLDLDIVDLPVLDGD